MFRVHQPKANVFRNREHNSRVWLDSLVIFIYLVRRRTHATCKNLVCCKSVGGKTCNIAFELVLQQG